MIIVSVVIVNSNNDNNDSNDNNNIVIAKLGLQLDLNRCALRWVTGKTSLTNNKNACVCVYIYIYIMFTLVNWETYITQIAIKSIWYG